MRVSLGLIGKSLPISICRPLPGTARKQDEFVPSTTINAFIEATERAVNRLENYARVQNATLTKPIVKQIIADVLGAGGEYPAAQEPQWKKMLKERGLSKARYFEHFKGGKYKLIGFGKDSETLEDVVIYQALYGAGQIWVRPYDIFFSKVTLPDGTEVERFKEISSNELM